MWYIHIYTCIQKKWTYSIYMYMILLWQYVTALPRTQCNMAITHREQLPYINLYMYMYMYTHVQTPKYTAYIYIYKYTGYTYIWYRCDNMSRRCHEGKASSQWLFVSSFHIYTHIYKRKNIQLIYICINIQLLDIYDTAWQHVNALLRGQGNIAITHREQLPHILCERLPLILTHIQTQTHTAYIYMYK